MTDFWGLTKDQMLAQNISIIGWGFSYQAKNPRSKEQICDFKFKSGTFNRGDLFIKSDLNVRSIKGRSLQKKMSDLLRINFNYMRAYKLRTLKTFSPVNWYLTKHDHWESSVPKCPVKKFEKKF